MDANNKATATTGYDDECIVHLTDARSIVCDSIDRLAAVAYYGGDPRAREVAESLAIAAEMLDAALDAIPRADRIAQAVREAQRCERDITFAATQDHRDELCRAAERAWQAVCDLEDRA